MFRRQAKSSTFMMSSRADRANVDCIWVLLGEATAPQLIAAPPLAPDFPPPEGEVAPGSRTLTRRDPRVCGLVGKDVLDGHEQEEDLYAGVSP